MDDAPRPRKVMTEADIIAAIDDSDNRAYGSNLSNLTAQLSAERALNIDLYLGKNVDPAPEGNSQALDRTVFETVQWVLPSLCRIFANGDDVVAVLPVNEQDIEQAKQETAYLNWLVTQKRPWFDIFLEWATDALLTKNAYFLVYRDRKRAVEIEHYEQQTKIGVNYLLQDQNVQLVESREYPAPDMPPEPLTGPDGQPVLDANGQPVMQPVMLYDVTIRRRSEEKDVCIRVLPPERVKVDQRAYNWRVDDNCNYFEYWEETTLSDLREQGYEISDAVADDPEIYTQEDYARDQYGERRLERYKPTDPSMRRVRARMCWIRVDANGDGIAELLSIVRVGRHILAMEEVSRIPVASGVACPLPHRHIGISLADMVADLQRYKTAILRQGLNNLYLSNDPQKIIDETKVNIDDALISRPGGLIRAKDVEAVQFVTHPFVFPQAIEGLEYMDKMRQARTGVDNTFGGIDGSALTSIQPGTVAQISSMAALRVEQIARIMAFALEDLFSIVHEQVLKMGHVRQTVQLLGKWAEVDPGSWKKRTSFKICVAFNAGNKDAQLARLSNMLVFQQQALQMGLPVVTPENYYNTLVELTKAADFAAPERFWTDPAKIPPRPPQIPEAVQKAMLDNETKQKIAAAEIIQREVESQRKASVDKYAIDVGAATSVATHKPEEGESITAVKKRQASALSDLTRKDSNGPDVTVPRVGSVVGHIKQAGTTP